MASRRRSTGTDDSQSTVDSNEGQPPSSVRNRRIRTYSGEVPLYQVDLSLPPESRYTQICKDYKDEMGELVGVYDGLLFHAPSPRFFGFLARTLLKRVHSTEETREIKGISEASGVPMHLVVAYNTFLDLFSGCTSGGARVKVPRAPRETRMIHFRNLDWDMEPLRDMIIRVEYLVGGSVVARAVTYAGYIGTLTGVREGLSISMNYRARVQSTSSTFLNRFHHLQVLLGFQPSIASQLRQILLSPDPPPTLDELSQKFAKTKASSCYLTFCTPSSVLVIEKDLKSAVSHTSDEFLSVTNHDVAMEAWTAEGWRAFLDGEQRFAALDNGPGSGVKEIVAESMERKECVCSWWREKGTRKATVEDVKSWLRKYPVQNECTHYSCIMDPSAEGGGLAWLETSEPDSNIGGEQP